MKVGPRKFTRIEGDPRQPTGNLCALYELAHTVRDDFTAAVRTAARRSGADGPEPSINLKYSGRARAKIDTELAGDGARLLDLMRCSLVYPSLAAVYAGAKALVDAGPFEIVRARDRFADPGAVGYRDVVVNLRHSLTGFIVEVQLHQRAMLAAKTAEQPVYTARRVLALYEPQGDKTMALERVSRTIYDIAWPACLAGRDLSPGESALISGVVASFDPCAVRDVPAPS